VRAGGQNQVVGLPSPQPSPKAEPMILVRLRTQSLATSPLRPFVKEGERTERGDVSPRIRCTNLVWCDLVREGVKNDA
jgi:hypothetical protein